MANTTSSTSAAPKAVLFLGATGGCGLAALRYSLAAGHICTAVQRTPARLTALLTPKEQAAVRIVQGNAKDVATVAQALRHPSREGALVDAVVFSIGGAWSWSNFGADDPAVCGSAMRVLLEALAQCRDSQGRTGRPRVVAVSSTGISKFGRDIPRPMVPLYHGLLKGPHEDKRVMEDLLIASGEDWTVVRASLLTSGEEGIKPVREGMEDPQAGKVESLAIGYSISRADVGVWIFDNIVERKNGGKWVKKVATLTY